MTACEQCWTEANRQVFLLGGSVVERYRKLIAASPLHPVESDWAAESTVGA